MLVLVLLVVVFVAHLGRGTPQLRKPEPKEADKQKADATTAVQETATTVTESTIKKATTATVTSETKKEFDETTFQERQTQAASGIQEMLEKNILTTAFTQREIVLTQGFPHNWKPCVLQRRFRYQETLKVTVVGGASAAQPGQGCPAEYPDGRWSTILQSKLGASGKSLCKFAISNMAHGRDTSSIQTSLLLDGLIDPNETDVIIWDFLINGKYQRGRENY